MASVWYCLNKTGHSPLPNSWLKNSKQISWEQRIPRLPKIPEPSWGDAVFWNKAILLRTILDHAETSQGFSVVSRKSTDDLILRRLNTESTLWFQGRNWSMGKRSFSLNAGRVRVILCSEPLRKTWPESFLFSPPLPTPPSFPPLPVIYAGLGSSAFQ